MLSYLCQGWHSCIFKLMLRGSFWRRPMQKKLIISICLMCSRVMLELILSQIINKEKQAPMVILWQAQCQRWRPRMIMQLAVLLLVTTMAVLTMRPPAVWKLWRSPSGSSTETHHAFTNDCQPKKGCWSIMNQSNAAYSVD
jgi:hypothetical protein